MATKPRNSNSKKFIFREWAIDLFKDEKGDPSIKPVIAFIGCFFLCVSMVVNAVVPGSFTPSDSLVDAIMVITAIGMGADSIDKFSLKRGRMRSGYGGGYGSSYGGGYNEGYYGNDNYGSYENDNTSNNGNINRGKNQSSTTSGVNKPQDEIL